MQGTPNPLQYMARELDALSGLYYVRNRWYDPQQGRFVSEDLIGLAGGVNHYAYVGNDPANATDPTGLCTYRGLSNDGRKIVVYIPDVTWGNSGGGPVKMFLSCSGMDWIYINKMNAVLVANYDVAWASMYSRSVSGPRGVGAGGISAPETRASEVSVGRCTLALGLFGLQAASDVMFFTGVGTAASLALRGTISTTIGRGLVASTGRIGLSSTLSMPVRAMAPEMLGNGLMMQQGAIIVASSAVDGWSLGAVGTAVEQALVAQGGGIGEIGLADFVPGWATWDAFQTAKEVCSGN